MNGYWQHFPHDADVGVRGVGTTKSAAFEQAALALTAVVTDPASVRPLEPVDVRCEAPDDEMLLVDWLNEVIFAMATRHMLFSRFELQIVGTRLAGRAWGEPIDVARHAPAAEPKGATYTALRVLHPADSASWIAECVIDV